MAALPRGSKGRRSRATVEPNAWHGSLPESNQDGSGKLYRRNRYYDPQTGRFTQEDPIGLAGGLNAYGFADGDPVTYSDPYGLCPDYAKESPLMCWGYDAAAWANDEVQAAGGWKQVLSDGVRGLGPLLSNAPIRGPRIGTPASRVRVELRRPYIRNSTRRTVESRSPRTADGKFIDPNTGQPIKGRYDLGHKPGHEFRREKARAEAEGLTQAEFNDRMNNPDLYQIEDPRENRSHRHEQKP